MYSPSSTWTHGSQANETIQMEFAKGWTLLHEGNISILIINSTSLLILITRLPLRPYLHHSPLFFHQNPPTMQALEQPVIFNNFFALVRRMDTDIARLVSKYFHIMILILDTKSWCYQILDQWSRKIQMHKFQTTIVTNSQGLTQISAAIWKTIIKRCI